MKLREWKVQGGGEKISIFHPALCLSLRHLAADLSTVLSLIASPVLSCV